MNPKQACFPHLKCLEHGLCEGICIIFTGEVEAVHLPVVSPLMEGEGGLVVLESLQNSTVYDNLKNICVVSHLKCNTKECKVNKYTEKNTPNIKKY